MDTKKVLTSWNELLALHHRLERTTLELLRHPDATAEHIETARQAYRGSYERMSKGYSAMLSKFGNYDHRIKHFDKEI